MTQIKGIGINLSGAKKVKTELDHELGEIFREMRATAELSIPELAKHLETNIDTFHALESGDISALPPWDTLTPVITAYSTALDIDPDPLLRRLALGISNQKQAESKAKAQPDSLPKPSPKEVQEIPPSKPTQPAPLESAPVEPVPTEPKIENSLIKKLGEQQSLTKPPSKSREEISGTVSNTAAKSGLPVNLQKRLDELTKSHPDNKPAQNNATLTPQTPQTIPAPLQTPIPKPGQDSIAVNAPLRAHNPHDITPAPFVDGQNRTPSNDGHRQAGSQIPASPPLNAPLTADPRFPQEPQARAETPVATNLPAQSSQTAPAIIQKKKKGNAAGLFLYLLVIMSLAFLGWTYYTDPSAFSIMVKQILG